MYKIKIDTGFVDSPKLELTTDSKGEARAVASVCHKSKVGCEVTRQAAEVTVKYTFDKPAQPSLPTPPPLPVTGKKK